MTIDYYLKSYHINLYCYVLHKFMKGVQMSTYKISKGYVSKIHDMFTLLGLEIVYENLAGNATFTSEIIY